MPLDDWQFYVVTAAALWGLWALVRTIMPRKRKTTKRTDLTVEGRKP
ncbi:MAG: hypothetical protein GY715_02450 [Planctomycetes bacterium]|nr:hypothetical protein [Planctomycetota bacterium]